MSDFLNKKEKKISQEFEKKGYVIANISDFKSLTKIRSFFIKSFKKNLKKKFKYRKGSNILNKTHTKINSEGLNALRLKVINDITFVRYYIRK